MRLLALLNHIACKYIVVIVCMLLQGERGTVTDYVESACRSFDYLAEFNVTYLNMLRCK